MAYGTPKLAAPAGGRRPFDELTLNDQGWGDESAMGPFSPQGDQFAPEKLDGGFGPVDQPVDPPQPDLGGGPLPPNIGGGWPIGTEELPGVGGPRGPELGPPTDEPTGLGGGLGPELAPPVPDVAGGVPDVNTVARSKILELLNAQPVTADSLYSSPEAQAQRLGAQRGLESQHRNLAEAAAQNGTLGGIEGLNRGLDFASAEGSARYLGDLAGGKEQQRQSGILAALGLNQQGQQANDRLGFDYTQLENDANYRALLAALGIGGVA